MTFQPRTSSSAITSFLLDVLASRTSRDAACWLEERLARIESGSFIAITEAFDRAPSALGRTALVPTREELERAASLRPGWRLESWNVEQAARALVLLTSPHDTAAAYGALLDRLFSAADELGLVALYRALAVLPHPAAHAARAAEGVRSNMTTVLEAVALRNPYPADWLPEAPFNQMVLKVLFVGGSLDEIVGLSRRTGPELSRMIVDLARERAAARRPLSASNWQHAEAILPQAEREKLAHLRALAGT